MKFSGAIFTALALCSSFATASLIDLPSTVVQTKSGPIQGKISNSQSVFLGIPYAKPPVGSLRWKAPQDPTPWKKVLTTTSYGSKCLQMKLSMKKQTTGNEDCLYLNVWAPNNVRPKMPVMVFLHGGAFLIGSSGQDTFMGAPYDGESLARSQGAIIVTFNFRLGILGFLAHPDAAKENPQGSFGNYGMLDAVQALKWVQDNIEKFGGDKNRVFVFGESSGAFITGALVASPLAKGLFHAAGMESGFYEAPLAQVQLPRILNLQKQLTCQSLNCLRKRSAEEITLAQSPLADLLNMNIDPRTYYKTANEYGLVVDGVTLPKAPIEMVREGLHNKVPLIIGSNRDEAELFIKPAAILSCRDYEDRIYKSVSDLTPEILRNYPCGIVGRQALVTYASNVAFQCPTRRFARAAAKHSPVYQYVFSYSGAGLLGMMGAPHYAEVPYIFGNLMSSGNVYSTNSLWMISVMQGYWGQFAATGNPNLRGRFVWPKYSELDDQIIDLNLPLSTTRGFEKDNCDFIDGFIGPDQSQP